MNDGVIGRFSEDFLSWIHDLPSRRLLHTLNQLALLLRKHGEQTWSKRLSDAAASLRVAQDSRDPHQLRLALHVILAFFGGKDSIAEVVLSSQAGHKIKPAEVDAVNTRLEALRTQLFLSAKQTLARLERSTARRQARRV